MHIIHFDLIVGHNIILITSVEGCTSRSHGNEGRHPWNAMSFKEASFIVDFLRQLAKREGLQQPTPAHADNLPLTMLPAGYSKSSVHRMYKQVEFQPYVCKLYPCNINDPNIRCLT